MGIAEGLLLGVVQGLTEFLPVSSSGHLIVAREVLGLQVEYGLAMDAALHLATAAAVCLYFWRDITRLARGAWAREERARTLLGALAVGTVPAAVAGLALGSYIEAYTRGVGVVIFGLIAGSVVMAAAERAFARSAAARSVAQEGEPRVSLRSGVAIGLFQALALFPGMSRSGMTISAGLMFGLSRTEAMRFAFLLSFPIVLGAGLMQTKELYQSGVFAAELFPLAAAAAASLASGLAAIHFMLRFLRTHTLLPFILYRLILAAILAVVFF